MRLDLFDFDLPDERIALRPAEPRDSALLLFIDPNAENSLSDHRVGDLTAFQRLGLVRMCSVADTCWPPAPS
ncbi:S-adenosylmethionine:tRNA ribosyltransferase-isomerase, partial [Rhizobium johnstonii]|uniref:S-adenosylmethionine:tRNA ribosyltransferase-isomerase n=1 Tax=Rhizobium johnstonii TaxID=3019933 RepID=UPI003F987FE4